MTTRTPSRPWKPRPWYRRGVPGTIYRGVKDGVFLLACVAIAIVTGTIGVLAIVTAAALPAIPVIAVLLFAWWLFR